MRCFPSEFGSAELSLIHPLTQSSTILCREYYLSFRPDFMERTAGVDRIYLSKRILGQFFRHCTLMERIVDLSQFDVDHLNSASSTSSPSNKYLSKNPRLILPGECVSTGEFDFSHHFDSRLAKVLHRS